MPIITEEGFDTLQESTIQEDPSVAQDAEKGAKDLAEKEKKKEVTTTMTITGKGDSDTFPGDNELDDDDDDLEETIGERLWGLTEMFPDSVRDLTSSVADLSQALVKGTYSFSCNAAWVVASSATILVLPVMFELERAQMEQQQLQQQRQILLGPNAAASGVGGPMPSMPGPAR